MILSGGGDDKAFLWNANNGEIVYELSGHTDSVSDVGFSFDGKYVATASYDSTVKVFETSTGKFLKTLDGPGDSIDVS
jgi:WD40 repeat protein